MKETESILQPDATDRVVSVCTWQLAPAADNRPGASGPGRRGPSPVTENQELR